MVHIFHKHNVVGGVVNYNYVMYGGRTHMKDNRMVLMKNGIELTDKLSKLEKDNCLEYSK